MSPKSTRKVEEPENKATEFPFFKATRRIMLAAIGAAALAQDELEAYVNRLVERGEIAERDGRKIIDELLERRKARREQIMHGSTQHLARLMKKMNIPTREDIENLDQKLSTLTQKIESLKHE